MEQTTIQNDEWEVWTPSGWSDFSGVVINHNRETIILNDYDLECTPCHLLKIDGVFVRADSLPHIKSTVQDVYDLYEVDKNHEYFTNEVISHNCSVIYIDEAAFIANDNEFYESTYPVISSGNTTKIVMTSTPKGRRGMFFTIFEGAENKQNGYKRLHYTWRDDPRKDEIWKEKTLKEFGLARFNQEFDVQFRGSSGTLISPSKLQDMQFINPITEDQYIKIYKEYDINRQYIAFVDTAEGLGKDYSVVTVIDVTTIPHEVVCIYKNNTISPLIFPHTIVSICSKYGNCPALIETNNTSGGQVTYILYYELEYENTILTNNSKLETGNAISGKSKPGVRTTRKVKSVGCSNLSTIIDNNNLIINSEEIIEELGTFVAKNNSYEADKDCNDDIVMTLVLYAWYINQEHFKSYSGNSITEHLYQQSVENSLNSILPFGLFKNEFKHLDQTSNQLKITSGGSFSDWLKE